MTVTEREIKGDRQRGKELLVKNNNLAVVQHLLQPPAHSYTEPAQVSH